MFQKENNNSPDSVNTPLLVCCRPHLTGFIFLSMKKCTKCNRNKYLNEFYKEAKGKYGVQSICKICMNEKVKNYRRTKLGLITQIYANQKYSSKYRKHIPPCYSKSELKDWLFNKDVFHKLFDNWVNSGYNKNLSPSCDRLNDYSPYTFDNIRIVTWNENNKKGRSDVRNGVNNKSSKSVLQFDLNGNFIAEYYSLHEAARQTGATDSNLSQCCQGKQKTVVGYKWKYKF